ncbi:MAG: hypothetical protein ACPG4T_08365 [Nannocystaceae bacterium]
MSMRTTGLGNLMTCMAPWLLAPVMLACGGGDAMTESGTESSDASTDTQTSDTNEPTGATESTTQGPTTESTTETDATTESTTETDATTETETETETETDTGISEEDLYDALAEIDGMTVEELDSPYPDYRMFYLTYMQPQDHNNLDGEWFAQRIVLSHHTLEDPMVLATSGYNLLGPGYLSEPTTLLQGNQLAVEQRYFSSSIANPADWSFLTIEQAANDHHRIVEALAPIYGGVKWVSTGASKGGMTSVYHRRFFPDDVDATLAYVAPHNLEQLDPRYGAYVDGIGDPECAQDLKDLQADALSRRDNMVVLLQQYAGENGVTYDHLGFDRAFEFLVGETRFVFWQYGGAQGCGGIPGPMASDEEVFSFLDNTVGWGSFGDASIAFFGPYYYQAATQLGAPDLPEDHLGDLRAYPGENTAELYAPMGLDITWDSSAMPDVSAWMDTQGERLMFIYGGRDPWSATAFDPGGASDTHSYWVETANHGASLNQLPQSEFDEALGLLLGWTGAGDVEPDEMMVRKAAVMPWPQIRHAGL